MLIDFIDGAYEGWVLLYKLRRHSFAVKARLNRMQGKVVQPSMLCNMVNDKIVPGIKGVFGFFTKPKPMQENSFSEIPERTQNQINSNRQKRMQSEVIGLAPKYHFDQAYSKRTDDLQRLCAQGLNPIKQQPIIKRNPWERDRSESGNFMWDTCYSMMRQFGWSIEENWMGVTSAVCINKGIYRKVFYHIHYPDDCDLVQAIREFVTKPVA